MAQKAPTLRDFQSRFPTEEICLDHLMRNRFGERHDCGGCGREAGFYRVKARRSYACEWCGYQVYPTAGTPFDRTRTSLRDWFYVMFQFCTSRNGVAAKRIERDLGVTYKTAWRMCDRIRAYMASLDSDDPLGGAGCFVEVDETLIGGVARRSGKIGRNLQNKTIVLGMVERGGELISRVVPNFKKATLQGEVQTHVLPGSVINTDSLQSYNGLVLRGFRHQRVNHEAGEYVGAYGCTVNTIEGFWAILKRGISGTYVHVSAKHLPKYLGEFEYRWNMRQVPHLMIERMMFSFAR